MPMSFLITKENCHTETAMEGGRWGGSEVASEPIRYASTHLHSELICFHGQEGYGEQVEAPLTFTSEDFPSVSGRR